MMIEPAPDRVPVLYFFRFVSGDGGGHNELTHRQLSAPFLFIFPRNRLFLYGYIYKTGGPDYLFQIFN
jgi:hypothetical protein